MKKFQRLVKAQQADWGGEIIAAPDSSWSPQQILGGWTQAEGEEETLVPGVSLSPVHTFKLRWTTVVRRKGMDGW